MVKGLSENDVVVVGRREQNFVPFYDIKKLFASEAGIIDQAHLYGGPVSAYRKSALKVLIKAIDYLS